MSIVTHAAALRILLAHRHERATRGETRFYIHRHCAAIRCIRARVESDITAALDAWFPNGAPSYPTRAPVIGGPL